MGAGGAGRDAGARAGQGDARVADSSSVSGNGFCNRFSGPITISADRISFGPLISTMMACADAALTNQESRFLAALSQAERYEMDASTLRIYPKGGGQALGFSRTVP